VNPAAPQTASPAPPRRVVLSGRSGAGKQLAAHAFEDMGWRVVDNLPPALLPDLFRGTIADEHDGSLLTRPLCVVCDVRAGEAGLRALGSIFDGLRDKDGLSFTLLFLDASDDALVRRFKETRRSHPLFARTQSILDALAAEQDLLVPIRARADKVIDTSACRRATCGANCGLCSATRRKRRIRSRSRSPRSASSTARRRTPICCLTFVFCATRITWTRFDRSTGATPPSSAM
jgi:RNase adaptor protein for sRNA GlmZ degradation